MYRLYQSKNIIISSIKKALIGFLIGAFLFNDIAYASDCRNLAPELRLTRQQFKEDFKAGYTLLANEAVNEYIEKYLISRDAGKRIDWITEEDVRQFRLGGKKDLEKIVEKWWKSSVILRNTVGEKVRQEFMVVCIPGLLKNTGQAGHAGLGRMNGFPVIYMDEAYYYDQAAIEKAARDYMAGGAGRKENAILHDMQEIEQYEEARASFQEDLRRSISYDEMRRRLESAPAMALRFHKESRPLDQLYAAISLDPEALDLDAIYELYRRHGLASNVPGGQALAKADKSRRGGVNIAAGGPAAGPAMLFMAVPGWIAIAVKTFKSLRRAFRRQADIFFENWSANGPNTITLPSLRRAAYGITMFMIAMFIDKGVSMTARYFAATCVAFSIGRNVSVDTLAIDGWSPRGWKWKTFRRTKIVNDLFSNGFIGILVVASKKILTDGFSAWLGGSVALNVILDITILSLIGGTSTYFGRIARRFPQDTAKRDMRKSFEMSILAYGVFSWAYLYDSLFGVPGLLIPSAAAFLLTRRIIGESITAMIEHPVMKERYRKERQIAFSGGPAAGPMMLFMAVPSWITIAKACAALMRRVFANEDGGIGRRKDRKFYTMPQKVRDAWDELRESYRSRRDVLVTIVGINYYYGEDREGRKARVAPSGFKAQFATSRGGVIAGFAHGDQTGLDFFRMSEEKLKEYIPRKVMAEIVSCGQPGGKDPEFSFRIKEEPRVEPSKGRKFNQSPDTAKSRAAERAARKHEEERAGLQEEYRKRAIGLAAQRQAEAEERRTRASQPPDKNSGSSSDPTIMSEGSRVMPREEHEKKQERLKEQVGEIASTLEAACKKLLNVSHTILEIRRYRKGQGEWFFDMRLAAQEILANRGRITPDNNIIFDAKNRNRFTLKVGAGASSRDVIFEMKNVVVDPGGGERRNQLGEREVPSESYNILEIIDPTFDLNHAGRNALTTYSRTERKAGHELTELWYWLEFAQWNGIASRADIEGHELGDKIRLWANTAPRKIVGENARLAHDYACLDEMKFMLNKKAAPETAELAVEKLIFGSRGALKFISDTEAELEITNSGNEWELDVSPDGKTIRISEACLNNRSPEFIEHRITHYVNYRKRLYELMVNDPELSQAYERDPVLYDWLAKVLCEHMWLEAIARDAGDGALAASDLWSFYSTGTERATRKAGLPRDSWLKFIEASPEHLEFRESVKPKGSRPIGLIVAKDIWMKTRRLRGKLERNLSEMPHAGPEIDDSIEIDTPIFADAEPAPDNSAPPPSPKVSSAEDVLRRTGRQASAASYSGEKEASSVLVYEEMFDALYEQRVRDIEGPVVRDPVDANTALDHMISEARDKKRAAGKILVVGIDGNSGALKTTSAQKTAERIRREGGKAVVIERDWFIDSRENRYKRQEEELARGEFSLRDNEISLRSEKFEAEVLMRLRRFNEGNEERMALHLMDLYDMTEGGLTRTEDIEIDRDTVVVVEGNYILNDAWRDYFDIKVLALAKPSIGISRRLPRDAHSDKSRIEEIFWRINTPSYLDYLERSGANYDLTIITNTFEGAAAAQPVEEAVTTTSYGNRSETNSESVAVLRELINLSPEAIKTSNDANRQDAPAAQKDDRMAPIAEGLLIGDDASTGIGQNKSRQRQSEISQERLSTQTSQSSLPDLSANNIPIMNKPTVDVTNNNLTQNESILPNTPPSNPTSMKPWNNVRADLLKASNRLSDQNIFGIAKSSISQSSSPVNNVSEGNGAIPQGDTLQPPAAEPSLDAADLVETLETSRTLSELSSRVSPDRMAPEYPAEVLTAISDGTEAGGLLETALGEGVAIGESVAGILEELGIVEIASPPPAARNDDALVTQHAERRTQNEVRYRFTSMMRGRNNEPGETRNLINVANDVRVKIGGEECWFGRRDLSESEAALAREIIRAHVVDHIYRQIEKAKPAEKTRTINIWDGYANAHTQKGLMQEVERMTKEGPYVVNFCGIEDLISSAESPDSAAGKAVAILPLNDKTSQLKTLPGRVIFINPEYGEGIKMGQTHSPGNSYVGSDPFLLGVFELGQIEGLIGIGKAYLNDDEESFYRLYRLLALNPAAETVALSELKSNPEEFISKLQFILKPITANDPDEPRIVNERLAYLLRAA